MRISKLLMPAVTLAGALALAGCGGGGGTTPPPPPEGLAPGDSETVDGKVYTCDEDRTENCDFDEDNPPTEEEAEEAGIEITDARPPAPPTPTQTSITTEADEAKADAEAAYEEVTDASTGTGNARTHKTAYADVQGVSADAAANAMAILDAEPKIAAALAAAEAALEKAEGLDDDAVGKARLVASIENDIKEIKGYQETVERIAKDLRGSKSKAREASYWGTKVAKDLDTPLTTLAGTAAGNNTGLSSDDVLFHGSTRPNGAKNFKNAPVKGETLTGELPKSDPGASVEVTSTLIIAGLPEEGSFVCVSADGCAKVDTGKEIGDGWYLLIGETSDDNWYVKNDAGNYERIRYLGWGMWFQADRDNAPQAWAGVGLGSEAFEAANRGVIGVNDNLDGTATYKGEAEGLSTLRTTVKGNLEAARSGHFKADVELTATFATQSELEGTIDNFRGDAVGNGWEIEVDGNLDADGAGTLTVTDGRFSYETYGEANQRPTGIVGQFGKNFSDGAVAGVYHAD